MSCIMIHVIKLIHNFNPLKRGHEIDKFVIHSYTPYKFTIVQNYGTMELLFTMEKIWYCRKKNGTMDKTMVLCKKL